MTIGQVIDVLTPPQVDAAYRDAVAMGLVAPTTNKRRAVKTAMGHLVALGEQSHWNKKSRKALRQVATRYGIVVGNGRAKANFVRHLALLETRIGTLAYAA